MSRVPRWIAVCTSFPLSFLSQGTRVLTVPGLGDRTGTVLSLLTIFLTLQLPKGGFEVNWWGNTVFTNSLSFSCRSFSLVFLTHYSLLVHRCRLGRPATAPDVPR